MINSKDIGKIDDIIKDLEKLKLILSGQILEIVKDLDGFVNRSTLTEKQKKQIYKIAEKLEDLEFLINPAPMPKNPLF